jgi:hypothetical protein
MINETCLSLIASSVDFILEFQSILIGGESNKLDNVFIFIEAGQSQAK